MRTFQKDRIWFDLDGTLIDASIRQTRLASYLVRKIMHETLNCGQFWGLKRGGMSTLVALEAIFGNGVNVALAAKLWAEKIEDDYWLRMDKVLPEVSSTIARLKQLGYVIQILTARKRRDAVKRQIEEMGLTERRYVHVVSPLNPSKEKGEYLRKYKAAVYIGDTVSDHNAASIAGIEFLGVCTGQASRELWSKKGVQVFGSIRTACDAAGCFVRGHGDA